MKGWALLGEILRVRPDGVLVLQSWFDRPPPPDGGRAPRSIDRRSARVSHRKRRTVPGRHVTQRDAVRPSGV